MQYRRHKMSEWKKQVEEKARRTAIMYVLEQDAAVPVRKKRRVNSFDKYYGIFAVFMSVALAAVAAGFFALAGGAIAGSACTVASLYLLFSLIMLISGIKSLMSCCAYR